jgi:hypothetical protein
MPEKFLIAPFEKPSFMFSHEFIMVVLQTLDCYMSRLIDLAGKRFGRWKVLKRDVFRTKGNARWISKCDCGRVKSISSQHLISGATKSCGCYLEKDLTGKRFGKWTVVEKIKKETERQKSMAGAVYSCRCDCGTEGVLWRVSLVNGSSKSCGCSQVKPTEVTASNSLYSSYADGAKKRNLCFDLSKEAFKCLIKSNCKYCNAEPLSVFTAKNTKRIKNRVFLYNGIDRVDNEKGYTKENCVSCCYICNTSKWNKSVEEWLSHIKVLLARHENGYF